MSLLNDDGSLSVEALDRKFHTIMVLISVLRARREHGENTVNRMTWPKECDADVANFIVTLMLDAETTALDARRMVRRPPTTVGYG